jgi:hypothetical protein
VSAWGEGRGGALKPMWVVGGSALCRRERSGSACCQDTVAQRDVVLMVSSVGLLWDCML